MSLFGSLKRRNGHPFGCHCDECKEDRKAQLKEAQERRARGEIGPTLLELFWREQDRAEAAKKPN